MRFTIVKKHTDPRVTMSGKIIEELDGLYDDLNYYKEDPEELKAIEKKISIRELTLHLLLSEGGIKLP